MQFGARRIFLGAAVVAAAVCAGVAAQAVSAQAPTDKAPMSEEVFKNIQILKGIPVDTFFESMGMFANALGNDCTYCHSSQAYFDKAAFAEQTPLMNRARQMIVMMNTINKQFFGGEPRVTCFSCHNGKERPRAEPDILLQYGIPAEDPNIRQFPPDTSFTVDQMFDQYLQAVGGTGNLAKFTSYSATGSYVGFDSGRGQIPVEVFGRRQPQGPPQLATFVHMFNGDSIRTFDGQNGWQAGPDTPMPVLTLTDGNLDRVRLEAMVTFPSADLKKTFPEWRTASTTINERTVRVVQGIRDGQVLANFYFDPKTALLVRVVRWTRTPVGFVPTHIDLSDYRDIAGIKFPFRKTVTQTYMQMTVELKDIQPNVQVPASRFARPAPFVPKG